MGEELDWLYSLNSKGIKLGLEQVKKLSEALGNPLSKCIHIAGTNGKGSVARMVYTVLREAGHSVGIYTSPHLVRFNERIVADDREISDEEVVALIKRIRQTGVDATFFEFTTLMAFLYFAEKNVEYAVIETGMGGRLDATNIVAPLLSIITKISLDHQQYLGDTVEKIAFEKAGIIKPKIPVITTNTGSILDVIAEAAKKNGSRLILSKDVGIANLKSKPLEYQSAEFATKKTKYNIKTSLLGSYQLENIAAAILACEEINLPKAAIEGGIAKTRWPARLEVVSRKPLVILDGSHNLDGIRNLREFIRNNLKGRRITLVLGMSFDKDIEHMVPLIAELAEKVFICRAKYRGAPTAALAAFARKATEIEDVGEAVRRAIKEAEDVLLITGSLYVAGEAKRVLDV
jgi:dihydrofolate synthase/folylpolyglutamate synthase